MPTKDPLAGLMPRILWVAALVCGTGLACSDPVNPYDGYLARPADSATVGEGESTSSAESTSTSSMGGASTASDSGPTNAVTTGDTVGSSVEEPDGDSAVTSGAAQGTTTTTASATSSATTSGLTTSSTSSAGGASTVTSTVNTSDTSGTTGSVAPTTPATFSQIESYLTGYCATSTACHGPGAREVVLTGAATFDTLMTLSVSRCTNQSLVVPGDPSASALYNVLTGGCGNFRMPPSCPSDHCTGEENIAMIESWILSGALAN